MLSLNCQLKIVDGNLNYNLPVNKQMEGSLIWYGTTIR